MKYLAGVLVMVCISLGVAQEKSAGKFSGHMFGDYFYNIGRDGNLGSLSNVATPGKTAEQAFQFRRIYFTYDNDLSEQFTSRFRLEADQAALSSDGKISVFVKDAYLRWKNIFSGSDLYFGIQPTPAFEISEGAWGYRSLEKTIMDLRGIAPSRDLGIALKGKLVENGTVSYWILIADGTDNRPETDKYKRFYAHLQFKPAQNILVTLYADFNARPKAADPFSPGLTVGNDILTYAAFAGYGETGKYNIGAEGFVQAIAHGYNNGTSLATRNGVGVSVFGSINLQENLALVGRFDNYDPNNDTNAKADSRSYILGGLSWKVDKNVSIIPNFLYEMYERNPNGTTYRASVTTRMTLYYVFS